MTLDAIRFYENVSNPSCGLLLGQELPFEIEIDIPALYRPIQTFNNLGHKSMRFSFIEKSLAYLPRQVSLRGQLKWELKTTNLEEILGHHGRCRV